MTPTDKGRNTEIARVASLESVEINLNPIALRMAKTPQSFGHSKCNGVLDILSAIGSSLQKVAVLEYDL